jgi:hypothetical protein
MKFRAAIAIFFLAILFLMNGCASGDGVVTESTSQQTTGTVPGETLPDQGTVVPGGVGNPNASVRW